MAKISREVLQEPGPVFPDLLIVRDTYSNGDIYEGEMKIERTDSSKKILVKQGFGVYRFESGAVYAGEWVAGKMHGWGIFEEGILPEEPGNPLQRPHDRFEGTWVEGRRARGTYTFGLTGDVYQGEFVDNNLKHGRAIVWENREMFEVWYNRDCLVKKLPFDFSGVPASAETGKAHQAKDQTGKKQLVSRRKGVSKDEYEAAIQFLRLQEALDPIPRSSCDVQPIRKSTGAFASSPRRMNYVGMRDAEVRAKFRFFR